jgi:Na+-translocating ferredoxin:NAD+ oxidoreductase RnfC subunit
MPGRPKRAEDLARLAGEAELVQLVWTRIEEGVGYSKICMETGICKAALLEWLDSPANSDRASRARARAAAALVDEALEIADRAQDTRLMVGQRNWIAERFDRMRFGQKVEHEHKGSITHQHLIALQEAARVRSRVRSAAPAIDAQPSDVIDVVPKTLEQQLAEL